ncbi:MAG: hypothetical protein R6V27_14235 [Balneolaceae bacterium]
MNTLKACFSPSAWNKYRVFLLLFGLLFAYFFFFHDANVSGLLSAYFIYKAISGRGCLAGNCSAPGELDRQYSS